jgi:hypothetical protein
MARITVNDTRFNDQWVELTFSTDTNAYASGDLIADTQELALVGREAGNIVTLDSVLLLDKADQKVALFLVFLNAAQSIGTENGAPDVTDTNAEKVVGILPIVATDYVDVGGAAVASVRNTGLRLKLADAATSLWVAIVNATGTPTYGAADLIGKFCFRRS